MPTPTPLLTVVPGSAKAATLEFEHALTTDVHDVQAIRSVKRPVNASVNDEVDEVLERSRRSARPTSVDNPPPRTQRRKNATEESA